MLLAVGVGNTQTVIGLFDGQALACHWRLGTRESTCDELLISLSELMAVQGLALSGVQQLVLASVVPALSVEWSALAERLGLPLLKVSAQSCPWLPLRYEKPSEIGADRLADAVAAIEAYGAPVVVVDLGTATNIEVVDKDGAFLGGIICPGFNTSADALFNAAARLSRFDIEAPPQVIGRNTRNAVQSGLVFGEVARIDGLLEQIFQELGYPATVLATGGLAQRIAPYSKYIQHVEPDLTLDGLRIIYQRNRVEEGA